LHGPVFRAGSVFDLVNSNSTRQVTDVALFLVFGFWGGRIFGSGGVAIWLYCQLSKLCCKFGSGVWEPNAESSVPTLFWGYLVAQESSESKMACIWFRNFVSKLFWIFFCKL